MRVGEYNTTYLAITAHAEILNGDQSHQKRSYPCSVVDTLRPWPVVDDVTGSRDLEGEHGEPGDGVLPSAGETEGGVDKATDVHGEGAVDWIHDGKLGKGLHHEVDHNSDGQEANDHSRWASGDEGRAGTDEEAGANGAAATPLLVLCIQSRALGQDEHCNHLHVSTLETAVELVLLADAHVIHDAIIFGQTSLWLLVEVGIVGRGVVLTLLEFWTLV